MYRRSVVVGILIAVWWSLYHSTSQPSPTQAPVAAPVASAADGASGLYLNSKTRWSVDFLVALGNQQPSVDAVAFVNTWQQGEHSEGRLLAEAHNPLATTYIMPENGCWNYSKGQCHVKIYRSREEGLYATIKTISNGRYPNILYGLQTNNVDRAFNDRELGTWGTGLGKLQAGFDRERTALLALLGANRPDTAPPGGADGRDSSQTIGRSLQGDDGAARQAILTTALSKVGSQYQLGDEGPTTFDCSGFVQWTFAQYGIDTSRTTYTQLEHLRALQPEEVRPGDLIYFQFPTDQHVGFLGDFDGNGTWDLLQSGGYFGTDEGRTVHILYNLFQDHPTFYNAIIGYRRAL